MKRLITCSLVPLHRGEPLVKMIVRRDEMVSLLRCGDYESVLEGLQHKVVSLFMHHDHYSHICLGWCRGN